MSTAIALLLPGDNVSLSMVGQATMFYLAIWEVEQRWPGDLGELGDRGAFKNEQPEYS